MVKKNNNYLAKIRSKYASGEPKIVHEKKVINNSFRAPWGNQKKN